MVVLAASVVTKAGKALVSRQFVDMSRVRIEGLLAAFPKLIGSGKQHTYVETESVRYIYQPLENMYLVLVTNKASNILEDLETLRLLGKAVPDFVVPMEEEAVAAASFDLLFAFDEVVTVGGYKENVTAGQVRQNTEMESHEEKLHKLIIQSKINETKDLMKKKAGEIERSKMEAARGMGRGAMASVSSFGPSGGGGMGMGSRESSSSNFARPEPSMGFAGAGVREEAPAPGAGRKGMQLGKSSRGRNDFLESLRAEGETVEDVPTGAGAAAAAAAPPVQLHAEAFFLTVEERLGVSLNKDGGLEVMEVQGTMSLTVAPDADARVKVILAGGANPGYQFKTHPNIDKAAYAGDNVLGLKDPDRPFPTGAPLGVLKWRYQTADEALVPLTINCWPSVSGGQSYVNIEYESTAAFDLQHVEVVVPLPALGAPPQVNSIDGDWRYDSRRSTWIWTIELIDDSNRSGSAEFVVPAADPAAFFPIDVTFSAAATLCDVRVDTVVEAQGGAPVKFGTTTKLVTDGYRVE